MHTLLSPDWRNHSDSARTEHLDSVNLPKSPPPKDGDKPKKTKPGQ